jgi:hypothetical protein
MMMRLTENLHSARSKIFVRPDPLATGACGRQVRTEQQTSMNLNIKPNQPSLSSLNSA